MPTLPPPQLYHLMGFNPTGDLGPFTFYTKKNGTIVFFLKAPPKTPPTFHQTRQHNLWKAAAIQWQHIAPEIRANWTLTQQRAHLGITGYNLFIYWSTTGDLAAIKTIQHQTGLQLLYA